MKRAIVVVYEVESSSFPDLFETMKEEQLVFHIEQGVLALGRCFDEVSVEQKVIGYPKSVTIV